MTRFRDILIVDDDPVASDLLKELLAAEGYSVDASANGREALASIKARRYDLLITDLAMPELDGLSLLAEVKRALPLLRVIVMTGSREEEMHLEAIRRGADLVVSKPVPLTEIIRAIRLFSATISNDMNRKGG